MRDLKRWNSSWLTRAPVGWPRRVVPLANAPQVEMTFTTRYTRGREIPIASKAYSLLRSTGSWFNSSVAAETLSLE